MKISFSLFTFHLSLFTKKGFTLLEIMLALAVVGGLLVTLLYSLNYHLGIADRHETVTVASMLAKGKLLELEKNPAAAKGDFQDSYRQYRFTTEVKDSPYPGIVELSVTVVNGGESVKLSKLVEKQKFTNR